MDYYSLNQYLKDTFGTKVYKIAIDGGFTCPNRDGTLDTRGCIFCSGHGSGDFAEDASLSVTEQIERGKLRLSKKMPEGKGKYIAYFQAYTNTYAPICRLKSLFTKAISHPDIVGLSIATRPDCLPDDVISLLQELNTQKPVWVELGLQTIHKRSADYIRRGYILPVYDDAVIRLKEAGLTVITHVILGLPGETKEEMKETVAYVGNSSVDGIKLQLLHVLKGTDLAEEYLAGRFETISFEDYCQLICECLSILPETMVIHRMTGDGNKRDLIAPEWSKNKKRVLNTLLKKIKEY
ncbi:MAG: TIGR01212 family radical SAM protein [Lachnospiraceae bacterium]|nr:TIGR01212 family radical SAM protein [Lachnospiraceae bacterium]